ncbi:MAG: TaqI-like C-terminal specificity domain-containing protein [Solirubrobacterales bacterium]
MQDENFPVCKLVKDLRCFYAEINNFCSNKISYEYLINHIMNRINEDTGINVKYKLPDIQLPEHVQKEILKTFSPLMYNFKTAMEQDIMGFVYEEFLDNNTRKNLGLFYTPEPIVDFIIKSTIMKADVVKNPFITVLDPSCGSGFFLIKAYECLKEKFINNINVLNKKYKNEKYTICKNGKELNISGSEYWKIENIHYHLIRNCIYGADVDRFGVMFTKNSLKFKEVSSVFIEPNVVVCNSLVKWERGFGTLKEFWNKKFNYIIGNPPWVSLARKQGRKISSNIMNYYKDNYQGNTYLPNLYEYFILRGLELLEEGGILGFIIPDRFAKNLQFSELRKNILKEYNLKNILYGVKFKNISADSIGIIIENSFSIDNKVNFSSLEGEVFNCLQQEVLNTKDVQFSYKCIELRETYNSIRKNSIALKDAAITFTGFIGITDKVTEEKICPFQVPVIKGVNIGKYKIKDNKYYHLISENIIGGTKNISKLKTKEKIVIRKTGNTLVAAYDNEGYGLEQSLYGIIPFNPEFNPKYILAVLNSKLMEWYYTNFLITNADSTPQIKKIHLDEIPLRRCSLERQLYIEELVVKIEDSTGGEYKELIAEIEREILDIYS